MTQHASQLRSGTPLVGPPSVAATRRARSADRSLHSRLVCIEGRARACLAAMPAGYTFPLTGHRSEQTQRFQRTALLDVYLIVGQCGRDRLALDAIAEATPLVWTGTAEAMRTHVHKRAQHAVADLTDPELAARISQACDAAIELLASGDWRACDQQRALIAEAYLILTSDVTPRVWSELVGEYGPATAAPATQKEMGGAA